MKLSAVAEGDLAAVVAERTGTDTGRDLYPGLVAAAVQATVRTASVRWLQADPPIPLPPLLREALGLLANGLPDPSAERPDPPSEQPDPSAARIDAL